MNTQKVLINQNNEYVLYNEKEFAQSINVPEDIINCIEDLGYNWKENHLNNNITSIELLIKHDYDYALNVIKKIINDDKNKHFILIRYVQKNNEFREKIYNFSKLFFPNEIGNKCIIENFIDEIWKSSDEYIIEKIITIIEKFGKLSNINIGLDYDNDFLNFQIFIQ